FSFSAGPFSVGPLRDRRERRQWPLRPTPVLPHLRQDRLQQRQHLIQPLRLDQEIPHRLELLPSSRIRKMLDHVFEMIVPRARPPDVAPGIERPVCGIITLFQLVSRETDSLIYHLSRVIPVPVAVEYPALRLHLFKKTGTGIGGQYMEGTRCQ